MSILVSPQELRESIYHGERFTLLATHWQPQLRQSYNEFTSLHIPTALFSDTANSFAGLPGSQVGRNPLPDPDKLQEHFRQWGIREDRPVVVYDEGRGLFAGRAWWTLRWAGLDNVRILDGGLANWRHLGYTTLTGPGNFAVGATAEVNPGQMPVATIDDVRNHDGLLIDTRTRNRFAGRRENLDLKAGHIPGAVNIPWGEAVHPNARFKCRADIEAAYAQFNPEEETVTYCNLGAAAAHTWYTLRYALGFEHASLYDGSWAEWGNMVRMPVAKGQVQGD